MDEQQNKEQWSNPDNAISIEMKLKPDIDRLENRYRYLLKSTHWLQKQKWNLVFPVFLTIISLFWIFEEAVFWYSYILCIIVPVLWWYTFFFSRKIRALNSRISEADPILEQMKQRKLVLDSIQKVRVITLIAATLGFVTIWSFRSPERKHEWTAYFGFSAIFVMLLTIVIVNRRKLGTTRIYINNIISLLEDNRKSSL